jgi:hypothetical protein
MRHDARHPTRTPRHHAALLHCCLACRCSCFFARLQNSPTQLQNTTTQGDAMRPRLPLRMLLRTSSEQPETTADARNRWRTPLPKAPHCYLACRFVCCFVCLQNNPIALQKDGHAGGWLAGFGSAPRKRKLHMTHCHVYGPSTHHEPRGPSGGRSAQVP